MNLGMDMSMKLQQKLSFQMIQSLKLLQVNTLQLEQMLKQELELNPLLETEEELEESLDETLEVEDKDDNEESETDDEIDWDEYIEADFDTGDGINREVEKNPDRYEQSPVYDISLEEYLLNQVSEKKLEEKQRLLIYFIIGNIESDGYLRLSLDQIAEITNTSVFEVEEALNVVWNLEPAGIGARNLQECLILQLRRRKLYDTLAFRIINEAWDLFEKLKIPDIAKKFSVSKKEVQEELNVIKKLHPKPGYLVAQDKPSTISPDLIVEKVDGEFVVLLNDKGIPGLRVNKTYADILKRGSSAKKDIKKYVREKFNSATWLIKSIEQRKSTMLSVMHAIIEKQRIFFEKGPPNLNPLKLQDIADMIDMHISTVSRVTSNKYVQTEFGIFELKYFFTEAVSQNTGVGDVSSEKIKNRIRELIENEDGKKPLSDQKISDMLSKENLKVARRTVAKYREQLKILPARLRQKYD